MSHEPRWLIEFIMPLPEDQYPVDSKGRPDLTYYSESVAHYVDLYQRYLAVIDDSPRDRGDIVDAFALRVHGTWGLIAKGADSIHFAMRLLSDSRPEVRGDGTSILSEIGKNGEIIERLISTLESDSDAESTDTILAALGRMRADEAIPIIARIIRDPNVDGDTQWTAVESLAEIVRRRFLEEPEPVDAAQEWLEIHGY